MTRFDLERVVRELAADHLREDRARGFKTFFDVLIDENVDQYVLRVCLFNDGAKPIGRSKWSIPGEVGRELALGGTSRAVAAINHAVGGAWGCLRHAEFLAAPTTKRLKWHRRSK